MEKPFKPEIDYLPKQNWRYAFGMSVVAGVALWFADSDTYYGSILTSLPVLSGLWINGKSSRLGLKGERAVGKHLRTILPDDYTILSDAVYRGTQADYIVIGPGGVMVIEVKNWTGTVEVYPNERDWYHRNSRTGKEYWQYSPSRQNYKHTQALRGMLRDNNLSDYGVYGMVVFGPDPMKIIFPRERARVRHVSHLTMDDFREISMSQNGFEPSEVLNAIISNSECHIRKIGKTQIQRKAVKTSHW